MRLLQGQISVSAGGSRGLGYAIAERFVAEGSRVVLGDADFAAAQQVAERLGGNEVALAVRCCVPAAQEVDALVACAVSVYGSCDLRVRNAGITREASMRTMTANQFDQVTAVQLKDARNGMLATARTMRDSRRVAIISMSSLSGKIGLAGTNQLFGSQSQHRCNDQSRRKTVGPPRRAGKCNGADLIRSAMTSPLPQSVWDRTASVIKMGRAGEPAEVARVALFLGSDLSSYLTGAVNEVTGAQVM